MIRVVLAAALTLAVTSTVCAQEALSREALSTRALLHHRWLTAAPDAPVAELGWRDGIRARVGIAIPAFVENPGWAVHVIGAFAIYNRRFENLFPFELWRGILGFHASHRWAITLDGVDDAAVGFDFGFDHESDHESFAGPPVFPWFIYTNALTARGDILLGFTEISLSLALTLRAHLVSCTGYVVQCDGRPPDGAQGFEADFDATVRTGDVDTADGDVRFCAALHLGYINGGDAMIEEIRAALMVGGCIRFPDTGEWQLLANGVLGSDTGMHRGMRAPQLGGVLRWVL